MSGLELVVKDIEPAAPGGPTDRGTSVRRQAVGGDHRVGDVIKHSVGP